MPPDMDVSMRHTKLKPEEAALLAGEISKPSWESRNEGIHERVSFEDSIWGFDLAGGSFYKTPLRVTFVKPDSRASKAGIRPGDRLLKINDIDTSTLTIQEAHDIIISSGIYLKLSVTSPEDDEDAYYCYEDPLVDGYDSEEERRLEEEKAAKRRVHAKVSSYWSLQWPWVSKRRLIYRESNCFMVNSKYEEARREKYPPLPVLRYTDDILLYQRDGDKQKGSDDNNKETPSVKQLKESNRKSRQQKVPNGDVEKEAIPTDDEQPNDVSEDEQIENQISPIVEENDQEVIENYNLEKPVIEELEENGDDNINNLESVVDDLNEENSDNPEVLSRTEETIPDTVEESRLNEEIEQETSEDDILNEVLAKSDESTPSNDADNILHSILSDDGQNLENSEVNNER
ncbi:unnamed protein product [Arctia plantaginis]|uniref:PDZ domain-containing protein n=1 Tax=Arctia plantaginis TaxID=874455 RepID=A0A8S0YVA8_ARCPL|nr:unnamed protein product [Arctia plantaginis]